MGMQIPYCMVSEVSIQDIKREVGRSVREVIKQLCEWKRVEILEGSVQIDHIHLVLSIPPKHSVSEFVGFVKGKSAIQILV